MRRRPFIPTLRPAAPSPNIVLVVRSRAACPGLAGPGKYGCPSCGCIPQCSSWAQWRTSSSRARRPTTHGRRHSYRHPRSTRARVPQGAPCRKNGGGAHHGTRLNRNRTAPVAGRAQSASAASSSCRGRAPSQPLHGVLPTIPSPAHARHLDLASAPPFAASREPGSGLSLICKEPVSLASVEHHMHASSTLSLRPQATDYNNASRAPHSPSVASPCLIHY